MIWKLPWSINWIRTYVFGLWEMDRLRVGLFPNSDPIPFFVFYSFLRNFEIDNHEFIIAEDQ